MATACESGRPAVNGFDSDDAITHITIMNKTSNGNGEWNVELFGRATLRLYNPNPVQEPRGLVKFTNK